MQQLRLLTLLIILFLANPTTFARETGLSLGSGILGYDMGRTANDISRVPFGFSEVYLAPLHMVGFLKIGERFALSPHALYTLIPSQIADGAGSTSVLYVAMPLAYQFGKTWDVQLGVGYFSYRISGLGGTKNGNNGTGTSTFGLPGGAVTSKSYAVEIGIGQTFGLLNGQLDMIILDIGSNDKRSFTFLLSFNYALLGG